MRLEKLRQVDLNLLITFDRDCGGEKVRTRCTRG